MIYLDNASTTFLKPQSVYEAMNRVLVTGLGNPGRGANKLSMAAGRILEDTREAIMAQFHFTSSSHVILKSSVTESLNTLLLGLLKPGDHVISSVMEHNSVLRPLAQLKAQGRISYDLLPCDDEGFIQLHELNKLEKPETKAIILTHVSNLTGSIQPIGEVRKHLKNKNIFILIDAAQSAGYVPIDFSALQIDALAFTGHKGLLGPQGTGGFLLNERLNEAMDPVFTGGTGSDSLSLFQPLFLPDKFEAGTHNLPGIAGLYEGVSFVNENTIEKIFMDNTEKSSYFLSEVTSMKGIRLQGTSNVPQRIPNFSLLFDQMDSSEAAYRLENEFDIITRSGYHCAPLAHEALGTKDTGTLRISFGYHTTMEEIDEVLRGLNHISEVHYGK